MNFELVHNSNQRQEPVDSADLVFTLRILIWSTLLLISLGFQFVQPQFISLDVWLPGFVALGLQLACNAFVLLGAPYQNSRQAPWLFAVDLLCTSVLVQATGGSDSVFNLLYSVTVILGGIVLDRSGALLLAGAAAVCFNFMVLLTPGLSAQSLLFSMGVNNASFFALSFLSGQLGEQVRFLGVELVETRRDVEALKDLNQLVFENIGTGLLVTNPFGLLIYSNDAAARILGRAELKDTNLSAIFAEIDTAFHHGDITEGKGEVTRFDLTYKNPKNEKLNIEALVSRLYAGTRARGLLILFQDLTLVKNFEQQMRQREKLAAVGQLAAGIAHEIRNPLASISGSIQLLTASSDALTAEDKKLMNIVLKEIDRLNGLITEFLDYVRPDVRANTQVDVSAVLREVLDMVKFNKALRSDVKVETQLKANQKVIGHKDKLKQAFLNIIINSYQAMSKVENPRLEVSALDDLGRVVVSVKDNGVGIAAENLHRIFEPFHTTKPEGTGLGLAVTHKIFESHDAKVFVESEVGVGTLFRVEFPGEKDSFEGEVRELKEA